MNNKTIVKWFSALLLLMVVGVNSAFAQSITVDPLSIAGGDTKDLTIKLANAGQTVYGFQADFVLPEGFVIDDEAELVEETMTNGKEKDDEVKGEPTVLISKVGASSYRVMVFSEEGLFFNAKAEKILTLKVTAPGDFSEDAELLMENTRVAINNKGGQVKVADQKIAVLTFIDPNGPTPVFSPFDETGNTVQFLFNVEAKAFLASKETPNNDKGTQTACYQWSTHAAVLKDKGYQIKLTSTGDGTYALRDFEDVGWREKNWNEYDCKAAGDIWCDGTDREGAGKWTITSIGDNKYTIGNKNVKGKFGVYPSLDDIGVYVSEDKALGTTWAFVNEEDYNNYLVTYQKWQKNIVPTLKASTEPGVNVTPAFGNICTTINGWKIDNESQFHVNYWSREGASDGSGMTVNFLENWVSKPGPLGDATWTYTADGLVAGQKYRVSAFVRAYNEGSEEVPTGAYFYANDQKSDDIAKGTSFTYNNMAGVYMRVSLGVDADKDGKITLGIVEKGANFNWIALRDVQISVFQEINPLQELIDELKDLVAEALDIINQGEVPEAENNALKDAVKAANDAMAANTKKAYEDAIAGLEAAIEAADAVNVGSARKAALEKLAECQPIGDDIFQYSQANVDAVKAAIEAAETVDAVKDIAMPTPNAPQAGVGYKFSLTTSEGTFFMTTNGGIKIAEQAEGIQFVAQEDGTYALSNGSEYINYEGSNNWTMTASADPYGWTIASVEGGYTITGKNGLLGTNTSDGNGADSPLYGDKKTSNGNYLWQIVAPEKVFEEGCTTAEDFANWSISDDRQTFHLNTWSTENDPSGMKNPFIEYWRGSGNNLEDCTISHSTIEGLDAGSYTVKIFARAFNENNATDYPQGFEFFANDATVSFDEVGEQGLFSGKSTVLYKEIAVDCYVGEEGTLDLGFNLKDVTGDWLAFKNLEVLYNGPAPIPTAIVDIQKASNTGVKKVFRGGQIVILKGGKEFNVAGQRVK